MEAGVEARLLREAREGSGVRLVGEDQASQMGYLRPHYTQQQPVAAYPPINYKVEKFPARYLTEIPKMLGQVVPKVGAFAGVAFAATAVTASDLNLDETLERGTSLLMAMSPF